ncbi:COP9 signalosome complex subunit 3 [Paecilomyces variotii No. 5]|uniref:COP9 signalosome complex subunit 3 n=1 Tax=Byssochlamys spectabilis (strain No. 5 / NBRC 109023) TaxID=1356009 RepID=V5G2J6_BYSSN|nr:COP9 signalosome complex subunit 3 [Paecilomyces variotii No. 5]
MADLLPRLLSFSPQPQATHGVTDEYDKQIRDLIAYLKQSLLNKELSDPEVYGLLDVSIYDLALDPSVHSISFLLIFHFQVHAAQSTTKESIPQDVRPGGTLWLKALQFLKAFDPVQVRYAGHEWRRLLELVAKAGEAVSKPSLAAVPVRDAILRLDPSGSMFTSNHLLLSRLCLRGKVYTAACPVIDKDICHFPAPSRLALKRGHQQSLSSELQNQDFLASYITYASGLTAKITYRDYLQYFLYSSMIYIGLKNWKRALHFLNLVVSAPSVGTVSMVMVEAYKKWVIAASLPSVTAPHVTKTYRALARPYDALADAFKSGDLNRLKGEIDVGQSVWHMDNNTGLVLQLVPALRKFSILKLGNTFAALTISDVAHRTSPEPNDIKETETFVASLIMSGALNATLLHSSQSSDLTMLRFNVDTRSSNTLPETKINEQLNREQERLKDLLTMIEETESRLELSKEYTDNLRRNQRRKEDSMKEGPSLVSRGGGDIDEDIMDDLH